MHRIMQSLHEDHINVSRLLDLMENVLEEIRTGNATRLDVAYNTMRYMTAYPDLYHHPTEDIVFQHLMERAQETRAMVEQLFEEHQTIGAAGTRLRNELKKAVDEAPVAAADLVKPGLDYIAQLRNHMNTEEGEIFPLIKVILRPREWDLLDEIIAATGDPLFGARVQQSYRDLAAALTTAEKH